MFDIFDFYNYMPFIPKLGPNPEFIPKKHIILSYRAQNRLAQKRRKIKAKKPKRK